MKRVSITHSRKLKALGINVNSSIDIDKVIFNLSSRSLTNREKEVLSLGLDFALPPSRIGFVKFFLPFEKLCSMLKNCKIYKYNWNHVWHNISSLARNSFNQYCHQINNPDNQSDIGAVLQSLKDDDSIVISRPDKGKGVVILDKVDYDSKLDQIISDRSKFRRINGDLPSTLLKHEDRLNRTLRPLKDRIGDDNYNFMHASGSKPGYLYGLPKVHKPNSPLRPIISATGTFNHNTAKFLVPIISPLTSNEFVVSNSADFVQEITSLSFDFPVTLASFDIESLFTNVPLSETTKLIIENTSDATLSSFGLDKKSFSSLLEISSHQSLFSFNDQLYTQTDGVAMGSPLGPSFANAFLCHHEQVWLNNCPPEFKPVLYRRYMDDTFVIFRHPSHITLFLDYLNSRHPNIKFTHEVEVDHRLPFLDTLINNHSTYLSTGVYRKPTFTGLGTNFLSFTPFKYKTNSITTLLNRAYNICSSWVSFHSETTFLRNYFRNNKYPSHIFDKLLNRFLNSKLSPSPPVLTAPKDVRYIKLPYLGHLSYEIRNSLNKILRNCYPHFKFVFAFTNTNTIGNFLKHNSPLPMTLQSNVVYLFTCSSCRARYVGSTSRWLFHRFREHQGKSIRTSEFISKPSHSAIREHSHHCDHPFSLADFQILNKCHARSDLLTSESLLINKLQPCLNNSSTATPLFTQ